MHDVNRINRRTEKDRGFLFVNELSYLYPLSKANLYILAGPVEIPQNDKIKRSYFAKKKLFVILLHINPIVAFTMNN